MRILVLDLEAVRDPDVPFAPKKDDEFPPAACWQIVTIGFMTFGFPNERLGVISGADEREKVTKLVDFIERQRPLIVSWNGRGYDMPVILARALRYGLPMPYWFTDRSTRYRYSTEGHWDLKDWLSDFGAARIGGLDQAAKLVGFPGKVGVDGSQVEAMIAEGRQAEVDAYCQCDVVQTAALFLRCCLLKGETNVDGYRTAASGLLARMAEAPEVTPVLDKVDRKAFLLESTPSTAQEAT
jgi:predicted PolB exonuclease-like 3'-5' exonuclease